MVTPVNSVKVAVVQAAPVFMDKEGTLRKALDLVETCGKQDARIIVFPEAFIPAYPRGLSFGAVVGSRSPEGRKDFRRFSRTVSTSLQNYRRSRPGCEKTWSLSGNGRGGA